MRALSRKVDVRLPGKGNSNSHGARPVHLIITMIKRIRTSRLSIKNSLSASFVSVASASDSVRPGAFRAKVDTFVPRTPQVNLRSSASPREAELGIVEGGANQGR